MANRLVPGALRNSKLPEQPDAQACRCLTVLRQRNWLGEFVSLQDRKTPLYVASEKGHVPVVAALLERGATVGAATKVRLQPCDMTGTWFRAVIKYPNSQAHLPGSVLLYCNMSTGREDLFHFKMVGRFFFLPFLKQILLVVWDMYVLRCWSDGFVNLQVGSTSLHVASRKGHLPVVMALLDRGADVGARNEVR